MQTKTRTKKTNRLILEELQAVVDLCFASLEGEDGKIDLKELSNMTTLCVATLRRLRNHDFTTCIQYRTIRFLCHAAGLGFTWHNNQIRMYVKE